jgi:Leucine-rich repeat (LRR) protein
MTLEEEANEKALRRIRDAKEVGALELDLSELPFSRLPRELEQLTPLQDLNLSGCEQLNDLSPLTGLTSLRSLDLF